MERVRFEALLKLYINNECTPEELKEFLKFFDSKDEQMQTYLKDQLASQFIDPQLTEQLDSRLYLASSELAINRQIQDTSKKIISKKNYLNISAVITVAASIGLIIFFTLGNKFKKANDIPEGFSLESRQNQDIPPGKDQAILKLANGQEIALDSIAIGKVFLRDGLKIFRDEQGEIHYEIDDQESSILANKLNSISTPRGGRHQIRLPDGTSVWLNSASTLIFPTQFNQEKRIVQLEGEAYFEVAKDTQMPFYVKGKDQVIRVYGTKFNVSDYADDRHVITTLLEGKVSVYLEDQGDEEKFLKPGQQSVFHKTSRNITTQLADVDEALAWRNKQFVFNNMKLADLLKKISRWYDVEVNYQQIPNIRFTGAVPMDVHLSKIISILQKTSDIEFEINNQELKIKP